MIVVVRGINFTYIYSFPMRHLAVTVERAWATARPAEYEKSGRNYGLVASAVVEGFDLDQPWEGPTIGSPAAGTDTTTAPLGGP
ncbi:hypothetical protein AAVH_25767 [Aphelenchoides avenae]|nr:hypothetical protein AAVH_25767 [Aphelenchus avenae]